MYNYIFAVHISIFYDDVIINHGMSSSQIFYQNRTKNFLLCLVFKYEVNWVVFKKAMTINILFNVIPI